ncbi:hypothetical protein EV183_000152 [Coemansia sp. RSA 2336]|nr:hypothetical protein EV183_000152 [Coemansia sp. RSA 2336]
MSQNLNAPWLCNLFAEKVALNKNNNTSGQRLQLTKFQQTNEGVPVTCEVSDRFNYMRAGLTRKTIKAFKKSTGKDIAAMEGAIVQVKTFQLKLYRHDKPQDKQPDCPERISKVNKSQFWMLITSFTYLGGEGNAVFDQPQHIDNDPRVAEKLLQLTAKKSKVTRPTHDQARAADSAMSEGSPAKKRQRREGGVDSGRESDVGQLPTMGAAESVWTCVSLWQSMSIQAACVPVMPVYGLHAQSPPASRVSSVHDASSNACAQLGRVHASSNLSPRGQPVTPMAARNTLGGLLISNTSQLVAASDVMERMYGSMSSPVTGPLHDMGQDERIDANLLLENL